jgi:hypothetical protein
MKTNVRSYTDDQIIERVEQLVSFQGWSAGKYDIWVRSNEDQFDAFDDKVYSFEVENTGEKPKFAMVCSGTSHAGSKGLKQFDTKYGNTRCAVLASDLIVYDSHYYGKHQNKYWAYRQGKPFPYFEDTNKDEKIDETGKLVLNKIIYANNHRAGQSSTQIGGWSIACLVRNIRSQYDKWMRWMNKTEFLTVCILREWDPNENIPPVDPLTRNL